MVLKREKSLLYFVRDRYCSAKWVSIVDKDQGVQQPNQFAKVCLNCLPRNSSNLSSRVGQTVQS
jgi:hypothetical protein